MTIPACSKVFLRACQVGQPGTVIREHRGKLTVYWPDLDHWSHHRPEALEIAEPVSGAPATTNAQGERAQ